MSKILIKKMKTYTMKIMDNNEIGQLQSFAQLLQEEESIIIPKVQRDYVYGRTEDKARDVLDGLLNNMLGAVANESTTILDFVYGGAFVRENKIAAGLIPLDGQQRLTTLFLLFFYASLLKVDASKYVSDEEVELLLKFRYETRQSATNFCHSLICVIRKNLLECYRPNECNLKALIMDDAKYLKTYDSDPTITSMLNVLDVIERKCVEQKITALTPSLWERLMTRNNILFYKLTLDKFGLTDDLFIKMNARGKKLTAFEIFKSDMVAKIKVVDESLKDQFLKKMDTRWVDIAWHYTDKTLTDKRIQLDVTNEADTKYSMLFQNIFRLEYFRRGLFQGEKEDIKLVTILSSKEDIESVVDIFETLYEIHTTIGFDNQWAKYFYFEDCIIGKDEKVRLFWKQKHDQKSVFETALTDELPVQGLVYFYAMYLLYKQQATDKVCKLCLRVIRNLMTANIRAVDARTNKLNGFLTEVKYIIDNQGKMNEYNKDSGLDIDGELHKLSFIQTVWNEECKKQKFMTDEDYQILLKYENHQILDGSVALFTDYCTAEIEGVQKLDTERLFKFLMKFEKLFDNNTVDHFYELKTLFLDPDIEYMQCEPSMLREGRTDKMRNLITTHLNWSNFFIKNNQKKLQEKMLKILERIVIPEDYEIVKEHYRRFDVTDWKYYVAKYPTESNKQWTKYGLCVWDDYGQYPLDQILLNSSYHGASYLEWMMMTFVLCNKLNNLDKYSLDPHGCQPILITSCASTICFYHSKWVISTNKNIEIPQEFENIKLDFQQTDEQTVTVDFITPTADMDYIELGLKLVDCIENNNK